MKTFKPDKYQCPECKDIIHSSYQGEFVRCKCGKSFVDQTSWYTRLGGDICPTRVKENE